MSIRISKEFHFSASHRLDGLPQDRPCGRLHGHHYVVELELSAAADGLDATGFVRDHGDLSAFGRWLDGRVDHRHLNDVLGDHDPSAENLARWLYERWSDEYPELSSVRVSETPKT
ncbi:6-carboxytetrahydropterin synthase [Streptomyces sp. NPDC047315]|uniref:6-pyruvoyl trahydropterin synthase family protein n=1 Tax=Streptomyces sp. NPDC047315 TaxID=3155142 RepID=UPI0033D6B01F